MQNLYNSKIDFQESTETKDDYGTVTTTWDNVEGLADIACRFNWLHGMSRGESVVNNRVVWIRDCKVYCNYYSNINSKMRVVYNNENYNIIDFSNVDEIGKFMVLTLKREED